MNQNDIDQLLENKIQKAEKEIDKVFALRLKAIHGHLAKLFRKYADGDTISRSDIYKYRRFEKEMEFLKQNIQEGYKTVYKQIDGLMKDAYLENYLRSGYVYELTAQSAMHYTIPSIETVNQAILNPIKKLTLPELMKQHRNEIIRDLQIIIAQGIQAGQGYSTIAEQIENKVNFSSVKAKRVARTETGRVQTEARLKSMEHASKYAKIEKMWLSAHDTDVRHAHRVLDGNKADDNGYFHYRGHKAKGPHLFFVAKLDINCRCTVIATVNGIKPDSMRVRNYEDTEYQQKLANRIGKYMEQGMTESQATIQAKKEVKAPNIVVPYQPYEEWHGNLGSENDTKSKPQKQFSSAENARKALKDTVGFSEVEESFFGIDDALQISNAEQLVNLENKFGAIHQSTGTISGGGSTLAHVGYNPTNPSRQNLVLSQTDFKNKEELIKNIREMIDSKWMMPAENIENYVVTHEYGHILQNVLIKNKMESLGWSADKPNTFLDLKKKTRSAVMKWYTKVRNDVEKSHLKEIVEIAKETDSRFSLFDYISDYGKSNESEFFAEVFANSQLGSPNKLGDAMNIWLERNGLIIK